MEKRLLNTWVASFLFTLSPMGNSNIFLYLRFLFWIGVPITLLLLPKTYFDTGQSICPSIILIGKECPGCGLTRACMHLIHFDFAEAFQFNMLSFIVFPILAFAWAKWFWEDWRKLNGGGNQL